jgi:histone acetyltransferase (RNA polymerase elongator complex component)
MIVDSGFELVGQMMIGLPGSTLSEELETAKFIVDAGASGARIYPTVVFCETELALMCNSGDYTPLSLEDAIERSAAVLAVFEKAGIPVIRIGLCSSDNLLSDKTYFAGPNHPSLGELVVNRFYLDRIIEEGEKLSLTNNDTLIVSVSRGSLSKAVGQRRINKNKIREFFGIKDLKIKEDPNIKGYAIKLERETEVQKCI